MKIFRLILIIIGLFFILLFSVPFFLPKSVTVERTIEIHKPIDEVYAIVLDFNTFIEWNPWTEMESEALFEVVQNDPALGSKIKWDGDTIGTGYLKRVNLIENELIESELTFLNPWESTAADIMKFQPSEKGTIVMWRNQLKLDYPFGRYMYFIMDAFLGKDFEKGLNKLKAYCEDVIQTAIYDISIETTNSKKIYYITDSSAINSSEIISKTSAAINEINSFLNKNKIKDLSNPIAITSNHTANQWVYDIGIYTDSKIEILTGRINYTEMPSLDVVKCIYYGDISKSSVAYKQIHNYMRALNLIPNGRPWEEYTSDIYNAGSQEFITYIYYPYKKK